MTVDIKEMYRIFYMVKGHFETVSESTIIECYEGYFKRLWGNTENYYKDDDFEERYQKFLDKSK